MHLHIYIYIIRAHMHLCSTILGKSFHSYISENHSSSPYAVRQVGHTGPLRPSDFGRPIPHLERVLLDFPQLTVVGGHIGAPWVEEMIFLAGKLPGPANLGTLCMLCFI